MKPFPLLTEVSLEDIVRLTELDALCNDDPWTIGQYRDSMVAGHHFVLTENKTAWAVWRQVADEAELLHLVVTPLYRRQGIGYQLVQAIIKMAKAAYARTLFLEVRANNNAATKLYGRCGFKRCGRRKNYYCTHHRYEDALLMEKTWQ